MNKLTSGAVAGMVATAPMTVIMKGVHAMLPWWQRQAIPPRQITRRLARSIGVDREMEAPQETAATYLNHFAYGTGAGAAYGAIEAHIPAPAVAKGIAYGLGVWALSYLGWLPATGMYRPATREPAGRNIMMIAAHVVWGGVLGWLTERWAPRGGR